MTFAATLGTDKKIENAIRVEFVDEDGAREVAIYYGPRAVDRAAKFATAFYGTYSDLERLAKP